MSKAYFLLLQIEQQNEAYQVTKLSVFNLNTNKSNQPKWSYDKKKSQLDKKAMVCYFCKKKGHGRDTCFKLHGVPDWFTDLAAKKPIFSANITAAENTKRKGKILNSDEFKLKEYIRA